MSPDPFGALTVERLDTSNYLIWAPRMEHFLTTKGLCEAVTTDDAPAADCRKARAIIGLCVTSQHLATIQRSKTAKEAWDSLAAIFKTKGTALKLRLRRDLSSFKMAAGEPLTKYFARAKALQDKLLESFPDFKEEDIFWPTVQGLPSTYDTILTIIENTADAELTLDSVLPKLMQVEQRQRGPDRPDRSNETALLAKPSFTFRRGPNPTSGSRGPPPRRDERSGRRPDDRRSDDRRPSFPPPKTAAQATPAPTSASHWAGECGKKKADMEAAAARRRSGGTPPTPRHQQYSAIAFTDNFEGVKTWDVASWGGGMALRVTAIVLECSIVTVNDNDPPNLCQAKAPVSLSYLDQLDIKTAFLNGTIDEEVYVSPPPGYTLGKPTLCCKLNKALYGLKQAPRAWYQTLKAELAKLGFTASQADAGLFISTDPSKPAYLLTYVDDILIVTPKTTSSAAIKQKLMAAFEARDLGNATFFLGMDLIRDRTAKTIKLAQSRNIKDLLSKHPLDTQTHSYSALVGSLMYLSICTRPDIAQAVGALARHMANPTTDHWTAAKTVLRYLTGTPDIGITFGAGPQACKSSATQTTLATSTPAAPPLDAFIFNGGAISWASRLQPTVAASTTEAEYISAATTIKEGLWLRKLFQDLSLDLHTVAICADSQTALKLLKNPIVSNRSKHIDVVHHFARERVARNEVTFEYISTESMVADALTKPVPATKFNFCPPPAAPRPRASLLRAPRGTPPTPRHQQYSAIAFTAMAQPSTEPELSFSADGRTIYVSTEPPPPEFVTPFAAAIPFSFAAPPEPAAFSAQAPPTPGDTCRFVLDTGASRHMTPLKSALTNLRPPPDNLTVTFGNGAQAEPTAVGDIHLELAPGRIATITDVLYLPTAAESLFSVSYAAQKGYTFSFGADGCTIYRHSTTVATAPATANNIYYLEGRLAPTSGAPTTAYAARTAETPHLWHRRLGHLGFDNLAKLPDMVTGIRVTAAEFKTAGANALCEPCTLGKQHRLPFNTSTSATKAPLELLHTDLCGPLPVASAGGSLYFNTILDDFTGMSFVIPLRHKSDAADSIIHTVTMLQRQAGLPVKRVRSDNGGEFCNSTLSEFYTSQGVLHETTNPYSPQQNGKAERLNRTLGRDKTPFELFYGTKPDVSHLRIFGATVFAHTPSALRTKLDPLAMDDEMASLIANDTWTLCEPPHGTKPIQPSFRQREGIDYDEVFAPVSKYSTLRTVLSTAAAQDLDLHQLDIKTAFLNGTIDEEVYVSPPPGYTLGKPTLCCKLNKALYGLKQAPRAWYQTLKAELAKLGFTASQADAGLFISTDPSKPAYLLTYVDDILIVTPKTTSSAAIKQKLMAAFEARDLGNATFFLGMDLIRDRTAKTIKLAQSRNIKDLLSKYGMDDAKTASTPANASIKLTKQGTPSTPRPTPTLLCQTALKLLKNPIVSNRSKHIDVVHHFARERVARNEVTFEYISTESMVADALTKPVPATKFNFCRAGMGLS
ncbi:Retrovirus-related Pol poly from transposon TNT 1-94 [Micractinium conductrix]|uniref:Retrovirus-related Pol poly from transposon TNT 1-94 n=1 Tax=Micractinium conductrix TaxID=554055 RepID=A0A2P6UZ40_9CHLO|nr:Retrovirus-related Pol poly from transposon TNT 1-94 [Micractinium conductrix]|eukprot:PSC67111.1 Retrovirus-related Pol poly from transposon TNT 1-94 [Micractinium conductrix]